MSHQRERKLKLKTIVSQTPGAKGGAKNISTSLESWNFVITNDVISKIVDKNKSRN